MSEPANGLEWFGREVDEALKHHGKTAAALAEHTKYKPPYVSKVRHGKAMPSPEFAAGCDTFFGTSGYFTRILERISQLGHPEWFVPYVDLEREAAGIEDYSCSFLMGLLQTPDYAEAVFRAAHPRETADQIKGRAEARLRRRRILEREAPPLLWVIVHESVLRTVVGSASVMAAQLEYLALWAASPNVTVQVLPFRAGAPSSGLPFTLLTADDGARSLYSETTGQGYVQDSASVVRDWSATYERLRASAESEERSLSLIHSIMEEYAT